MCRILAITSFDIQKHASFIDGFFGLASCGEVPPGNEPGHLDGWGIGYYVNNEAKVIKSGNSIVSEKERFYDSLNSIKTSSVLILHLRKSAWSGTTAERHAHPFAHNNCLFAHNGVVTDYQSLYPEISETNRPTYDSVDTEVWFRHILDQKDPTLREKLASSAAHIRKYFLYSAMNCVLSDGTSLVALRDSNKWPDYYSLFTATAAGSNFICSQEITNAPWKPITQGAII
jgi:predicted glutamine amidotransferase